MLHREYGKQSIFGESAHRLPGVQLRADEARAHLPQKRHILVARRRIGELHAQPPVAVRTAASDSCRHTAACAKHRTCSHSRPARISPLSHCATHLRYALTERSLHGHRHKRPRCPGLCVTHENTHHPRLATNLPVSLCSSTSSARRCLESHPARTRTRVFSVLETQLLRASKTTRFAVPVRAPHHEGSVHA